MAAAHFSTLYYNGNLEKDEAPSFPTSVYNTRFRARQENVETGVNDKTRKPSTIFVRHLTFRAKRQRIILKFVLFVPVVRSMAVLRLLCNSFSFLFRVLETFLFTSDLIVQNISS